MKATETVSRDTRGFDSAKLINGCERHLVVNTKGLLITVKVTPATSLTATPPALCCLPCATATRN